MGSVGAAGYQTIRLVPVHLPDTLLLKYPCENTCQLYNNATNLVLQKLWYKIYRCILFNRYYIKCFSGVTFKSRIVLIDKE